LNLPVSKVLYCTFYRSVACESRTRCFHRSG